MGSVDDSDLTWTTASWTGLYYSLGGATPYTINLLLNGSGSGSNSGYTTMRIAGSTYARTSASFSGSVGTFSAWRWSSGSNPLTLNAVRDTYYY